MNAIPFRHRSFVRLCVSSRCPAGRSTNQRPAFDCHTTNGRPIRELPGTLLMENEQSERLYATVCMCVYMCLCV